MPERTTAITASATNTAAATPTAHKGSVNVPVERSSPGTQSRLIRTSPPHYSGASMAEDAVHRYLKPRNPKGLLRCGNTPPFAIWNFSFSVHLGARDLDHVRPFLDVGTKIFVELCRAHQHRDCALLGPGFLHAEPERRLVTRDTSLGDGRNVGHQVGSFEAGGGERPHLPGLHIRRHGGD